MNPQDPLIDQAPPLSPIGVTCWGVPPRPLGVPRPGAGTWGEALTGGGAPQTRPPSPEAEAAPGPPQEAPLARGQ